MIVCRKQSYLWVNKDIVLYLYNKEFVFQAGYALGQKGALINQSFKK